MSKKKDINEIKIMERDSIKYYEFITKIYQKANNCQAGVD